MGRLRRIWIMKWWLPVAVALALLTGCGRSMLPGEDAPSPVQGEQDEAMTGAWMARVNGGPITEAEFDRQLHVLQLIFRADFSDDPSTQQQLLDDLIQFRLLTSEAQQRGLTVDKAEVRAELDRLHLALNGVYGSAAGVEQAMAEQGVTGADLEQFVSPHLLRTALSEAVRRGVTVSEDEVRRYYDQYKDYLYNFAGEVVRAKHILVYQEVQARELAAKLRAGADFADLARRHSGDPVSAPFGGDLGYFERERLLPDLAQAAFALEIGQLSEPVPTIHGWHLILVEDRRPGGQLPYSLVRDDARARVLRQKWQEAVDEMLKNLYDKAEIELAQ